MDAWWLAPSSCAILIEEERNIPIPVLGCELKLWNKIRLLLMVSMLPGFFLLLPGPDKEELLNIHMFET